MIGLKQKKTTVDVNEQKGRLSLAQLLLKKKKSEREKEKKRKREILINLKVQLGRLKDVEK